LSKLKVIEPRPPLIRDKDIFYSLTFTERKVAVSENRYVV